MDWQTEYKTHLEAFEERIELAITTLERSATATEQVSTSLVSAEGSISSIDTHCRTIPVAMDGLQGIMQVNQNQLQELQRHLDAFTTMRDAATRAVPELQQHMDKLSQELADKMAQVLSSMHEGALEFGKSADRTNAALAEAAHVVSSRTEQIHDDLKDAAEGFNRASRETMEHMSRGADAFNKQMQQAVDEAAKAMSDEFRRVVGQVHESVSGAVETTMRTLAASVETNLSQTQEQVQATSNRTLGAVEAQVKEATERANEALSAQLNALDRAIERELQKVFNEMGSALATISRRIADDHADYVAVRERA